jgi:FkbH-like protein
MSEVNVVTDPRDTMPPGSGPAMLAPTAGMSEGLAALRVAADPWAPFPQQATLARRLKKILPEIPHLRPLRIALLGNGTLNHFAETLVFWLALEGFRAELRLAPYGAFCQEILDPHSALYTFHPDVVWLFSTARDIDAFQVDFGAPASACEAVVAAVTSEWRNLWQRLRANAPVSIVQNNLEAPAVRVFGHYDGAVPWSRANLIRSINLVLTGAAREENVSLFDLDYAASEFGLRRWHEDRHWYQSKQPFAPDAFGLVAFQAARFLGAMKGTAKKCVVLDLDDTLWGGVVGDDGLAGIHLGDDPEGEAFVAFQDYLKTLLARGILLAVCSKNEEKVAQEPFLSHPAMRLRLQDIVVFRANWKSKADNLRDIATCLNIGLDTLVFVDNNPVERQLVRSVLPEVEVPEMPTHPAEYVAVLAAGHYFDAPSLSAEDIARTRIYSERAQREAAGSAATDLTTFLRDLDMEADSGPADAFRLPRMAQLLARTNQFHPTTTRHGEAELQVLAADPRGWVRWVSLRDRFGEHGVVSVVVLRPKKDGLLIDTWAMSCRVFSRGLEELVFLEMVRAARVLGARYLIGHYCPTAKNLPVADLFQRLGFSPDGMEDGGSRWLLDLSASVPSFSPSIRWRDLVVPA